MSLWMINEYAKGAFYCSYDEENSFNFAVIGQVYNLRRLFSSTSFYETYIFVYNPSNSAQTLTGQKFKMASNEREVTRKWQQFILTQDVSIRLSGPTSETLIECLKYYTFLNVRFPLWIREQLEFQAVYVRENF